MGTWVETGKGNFCIACFATVIAENLGHDGYAGEIECMDGTWGLNHQ